MCLQGQDVVQLENRFEPMTLPLWEVNADLASLLASFASSFRLHQQSNLATDDMARYLLSRSEGIIGELTSLLTEAAVAAEDSGEESINHRTLTLAKFVPEESTVSGSSRRPEDICGLTSVPTEAPSDMLAMAGSTLMVFYGARTSLQAVSCENLAAAIPRPTPSGR
jgi:hypothetical protein